MTHVMQQQGEILFGESFIVEGVVARQRMDNLELRPAHEGKGEMAGHGLRVARADCQVRHLLETTHPVGAPDKVDCPTEIVRDVT